MVHNTAIVFVVNYYSYIPDVCNGTLLYPKDTARMLDIGCSVDVNTKSSVLPLPFRSNGIEGRRSKEPVQKSKIDERIEQM